MSREMLEDLAVQCRQARAVVDLAVRNATGDARALTATVVEFHVTQMQSLLRQLRESAAPQPSNIQPVTTQETKTHDHT